MSAETEWLDTARTSIRSNCAYRVQDYVVIRANVRCFSQEIGKDELRSEQQRRHPLIASDEDLEQSPGAGPPGSVGDANGGVHATSDICVCLHS
jgi:hypothetical protein